MAKELPARHQAAKNPKGLPCWATRPRFSVLVLLQSAWNGHFVYASLARGLILMRDKVSSESAFRMTRPSCTIRGPAAAFGGALPAPLLAWLEPPELAALQVRGRLRMQLQLDHGHHHACLPTLPLLELRPDCRAQQLQLHVVPRTWHLSLRTAAALSARKYQQSQHHPHQRHCRCPRQRHQVLRRPRHGGSRRNSGLPPEGSTQEATNTTQTTPRSGKERSAN